MADFSYPPLDPAATPGPLAPTVALNPPMVGEASPFFHVDGQNRDLVLESIRTWSREELLPWSATWQSYQTGWFGDVKEWLDGFAEQVEEYIEEHAIQGPVGPAGPNTIPTDEAIAMFASNPSSASALAMRKQPIRDADTTPMWVTDEMIGTAAGWWNMYFPITGNHYGIHLTTGAGFSAPAIIGIGTDTRNARGILFSNKGWGARGIVLDQFDTAGGPTSEDPTANVRSPAMLVRQSSIYSPAIIMENYLANSKPVLQFATGSVGNESSRQVMIEHVDNTTNLTPYWQVLAFDGSHHFYSKQWHFGGSAPSSPTSTNGVPGLTMRYNRSSLLDTELFFYRTAGGGQFYPMRISTTVATDPEMRFGIGLPTATVDGSEAITSILRLARSSGGAKMGFFGATPVLQPQAVPVTIAGVHAALLSLGLFT